jgi:hypothetical protein
MKLVSIFLLLTVAASALFAQEPPSPRDYNFYYRKAIDAYQSGNHQDFLANALKALDIRPRSNAAKYNAACGYALTGDTSAALDILEGLARLGVDYGTADDPDFESVRSSKRFAEIRALFEKKGFPINRSEIVFQSLQNDIMPEGIAHDPRTGTFYIGSMRDGDIRALDTSGGFYDFARIPHDITLACIGIFVDTTRSLLWACGSASDNAPGYTDDQFGITGIFAFDLATGKLARKIMLPYPHPTFGFNDLVVTTSGDLYTTGGPLFKLPAGDSEFVMAVPEEAIAGSNGICLSPDEKTLFVTETWQGIVAIDLTADSWRVLQCPDTIMVTGLDGLYYYDGSLIAVQNGPNPWRIVRIFLNDAQTAVDSVQALERRNPDVTMALTAALVGNQVYSVGHGPGPASIPTGVSVAASRDLGRTIILKTPIE